MSGLTTTGSTVFTGLHQMPEFSGLMEYVMRAGLGVLQHLEAVYEEAVITGDMIHHPCQIAHPDWSTNADVDQDASRVTRHGFLDRYADRPVLIIGTHFAGPTAGRMVRDGDAYRLDY